MQGHRRATPRWPATNVIVYINRGTEAKFGIAMTRTRPQLRLVVSQFVVFLERTVFNGTMIDCSRRRVTGRQNCHSTI